MPKYSKWIQVKANVSMKRKLRNVALAMKRTDSDTVRLLIDEAYQKLVVAPKNGNGQSQPAAEVPTAQPA